MTAQKAIARQPRSRRRSQRGSAIVELAITFLGFMFLSVGTMEFAMAMYAYNFCSYAARDASHWASTKGSQSSSPAAASDVATFVKAEAIALSTSACANATSTTDTTTNLTTYAVTCGKLEVDTLWNPDNNPGSEVSITVKYTAVPLAGLVFHDNLGFSSSSTVVIVH